jgi:outer membrane protein OmpA-like peptidoglycan-associated protein
MTTSLRSTHAVVLGSALCALLIGFASVSTAASQERRGAREVLLGTSGADRAQTIDDAASLQLDIAREDIARGDVARARSSLEKLITENPSREVMEEARELLLALPGSDNAAPADTPPADPAARPEQRLEPRAHGSAAFETENDGRAEEARPRSTVAAVAAVGPSRGDAMGFIGPPAPLRGNDRLDARAQARLESLFRAQVGDRVFFARNSADLDGRARPVLQAQAAWLRDNPLLAVTIEGHADDGGDPDAERGMSQRRAEVVRDALTAAGVSPERITIVVFGREQRVAPCEAMGCAQQNRRVVTSVGRSTDDSAEARVSERRERDGR